MSFAAAARARLAASVAGTPSSVSLPQPARRPSRPRGRSRADIRSAARRARSGSATAISSVAASSSGGWSSSRRCSGRRCRSPFGMQRVARAVHGGAEARGREHVLQRAPAAHVHVHVAGRHERQAERPAEFLQRREPAAILPGGEQFDRDPEPAGKDRGEPGGLRGIGAWRRAAREPGRSKR